MSSLHEELTLLAPAYALGALDADERRAFEAHVSTCQVCAAEVRSLARITSGLAQTPTQVSPRPELRDRVLTAVGASASTHRSRTAPDRRSSGVAVWLPLAATVVLAAGFALYAWDQRNQIRDLAGRLEQSSSGMRASEKALIEARRATAEAQAAIGVLTSPDVVRIDLKGQADAPQSSARAMWSRQRGMVFSGTNMPPLPAGRVYQVWVITDQGLLSAGLLGADGAGVFMTPADIPPPRQVAVTIEPAGGVAAPTMTPFLASAPIT